MAQHCGRTILFINYDYSICLINLQSIYLFLRMHKKWLLISDDISIFYQRHIETETDSKGMCKLLSRKLFMQIKQEQTDKQTSFLALKIFES